MQAAVETSLQAVLPGALQSVLAGSASASSSCGGLRCPDSLEPLRQLLGRAVTAGRQLQARGLLQQLGVQQPRDEDFAALGVVLAVFFPGQAVEGVDMSAQEFDRVRRAVVDWAARGSGQLPSLCLSLNMEPVALVNHVARRVYHMPAFHIRKASALLLDASSLIDYR